MSSAFQAMYNLLQSDRRYRFEAYNFVREALNTAQQQKRSPESNAPRGKPEEGLEEPASNHITGQQLCEACRIYALEQYGLIGIDQMRKSESDRREDFNDVYLFETAFEPQFKLPPSGDQ